jgi:hypothetical protein
MRGANAIVHTYEAGPPPAFTATLSASMSVQNPNFQTLGYRDLQLDVFHRCCQAPVARVVDAEGADVAARSERLVVVEQDVSSEDSPNFAFCGAETLAGARCRLRFTGTFRPRYLGITLPPMPISFEHELTSASLIMPGA